MQRNDLGTAVFGGMIALVGVLLLLDRSGVLTWSARLSIWPLLLVGYGLSRMVQSRFEAPRGLFPMAIGIWLFGGQAGWFSLRATWPLLLVALGLGIAWSSYVGSEPSVPEDAMGSSPADMPGRELRRMRRRRHRGPFVPLAILILILIAARDNTDRAFASDSADTTHAVAVLGEARRVVNTDVFTGARMIAVMGQSVLDLRRTALPASGEASVDVNVVMGGALLRVPSDWVLDVRAVPMLGNVHDRRFSVPDAAGAASGTTSRLVVTGNIVMGELTIVSDSSDH